MELERRETSVMLPDKIAQLKQGASAALTVAEWWETQIATHGIEKATAFYKHIGLNHLDERKLEPLLPPHLHATKLKSVDWEGLSLSREPSEVEKICVKGIAQAQESGKAQLTSILLDARTSLIESALSAIKKLTPATYHKLILTMPDKFHDEVRDQLTKIFGNGKDLVAAELSQQGVKRLKPKPKRRDDDDDELDDLADLTDARLANEIQARITAAATRFALLGLVGQALWDAISREVGDGSTGWLDRIATGTTNKVLNFGRAREMEDRKDEIDRYEQSELLDQNTCGPCAADDGKTASDPDDLPGAPNPDCEGADLCRGFIVAITI